MIVRLTRRSRMIWEWPTGGMDWLFWGWRPTVFDGRSAGYRIGPLTLWRDM